MTRWKAWLLFIQKAILFAFSANGFLPLIHVKRIEWKWGPPSFTDTKLKPAYLIKCSPNFLIQVLHSKPIRCNTYLKSSEAKNTQSTDFVFLRSLFVFMLSQFFLGNPNKFLFSLALLTHSTSTLPLPHKSRRAGICSVNN